MGNKSRMRFGAVCEAACSVSHRMPCCQRDFGRRTRPPRLPQAPSTESACSPTWRNKRWSTRTGRTSCPSQGKRKVLSMPVLHWVLQCRVQVCPVPGCWVGVLVSLTALESQGQLHGLSEVQGPRSTSPALLPFCSSTKMPSPAPAKDCSLLN